jgi:probable HAF family extracellular repeat protein
MLGWTACEADGRAQVRQFWDNIGLAAVATSWLCSPAIAGDTHFKIEEITIPGGSEIQALGINNEGVIVGGYGSTAGYLPFILSGTTVTTLPPTVSPCPAQYNCQAVATAINDAGDVVGQTAALGYPQAFLWHNGAYVPAGAFRMGSWGDVGDGPGLSNKGKEFFDYIVSEDATAPYAGRPATIAEIKLPGSYTYLSGMNNHGVLAGDTTVSSTQVIFFGKNGKYTTLLPPSAVTAYGAHINDLGAISGSYIDSAGAAHAFVYADGAYQVIPLLSGVTNVWTASINNKGRVVGTYTNPGSNFGALFLYNGTTVSVVTTSSTGNAMINDHGVIIFTTGNQSYRARCSGSGC